MGSWAVRGRPGGRRACLRGGWLGPRVRTWLSPAARETLGQRLPPSLGSPSWSRDAVGVDMDPVPFARRPAPVGLCKLHPAGLTQWPGLGSPPSGEAPSKETEPGGRGPRETPSTEGGPRANSRAHAPFPRHSPSHPVCTPAGTRPSLSLELVTLSGDGESETAGEIRCIWGRGTASEPGRVCGAASVGPQVQLSTERERKEVAAVVGVG